MSRHSGKHQAGCRKAAKAPPQAGERRVTVALATDQ